MPCVVYSYDCIDLKFSAHQNNRHIYSVKYNAQFTSGNIQIRTKITGEEIHEINYCMLNNNSVKTIQQKSQNNIENLHYHWNIENGAFFYHDLSTMNMSTGNIKLDQQSQSLQSLIYILLGTEISKDSFLLYRLITPPNQLHGISIKPVGSEIVQLNGTNFECWKLEIGLDGILGLFFPKWYYWASKNKPYLPLKYKNGDTMVYLTSFKIEG